MKNIRTRDQYEAIARTLIGLTLTGVTYYEIEYESNERGYLNQPHIGHFLDYGLEFRMTNGQFYSLLWDSTFYQYGVGIYPHRATLEVNTDRRWVVDDSLEWTPYIGLTIQSVKVYWSWVTESDPDVESDRTYYPQDLQVSFSGGRHLYISATQYMDSSDTLFGMSDEILVVFDEASATKYRIGPHAEVA